MEKECPKVSIIMPVYKVEAFVGKAIESMLNQTYTNFEFFCVDDGTPDNSGKICDEYAAKDDRIIVIHKENGGAPSARNMAMKQATGKYFYFLDSDDWAEATMLEDMVRLAEENEAQLVVTGFFIETYYSDTEFVTTHCKEESAIYLNAKDFRENAYKYFDKNLLYTPWNKLYLSSYIKEHNLEFPTTFMDDFPFVLSYIRDVERVVISDKQYYHFLRARAESETAKYIPNIYEKREEEHGWMEEIYQYWGVDNEASKEMVARRYIERVIGCIENISNQNCTLSEKERLITIHGYLHNPRIAEALKLAKPRSMMMKALLVPIRMKNARLTYLQSKFISKVKTGNVKLFAKLKSSR